MAKFSPNTVRLRVAGLLLSFSAGVPACSTPPVEPDRVAVTTAPAPIAPPATRKGDQVDDYHGTRIADPYRWLEQDSPETQAWVTAQNLATRSLLDSVPGRARIGARLSQIWNYPKESPPVQRGGRLFWRRNDGLQNQAVLCWAPQTERACKVLLDPNTLAKDGTVSLQTWVPSRDGKLLGYALASAGSDWNEIRVRDIDSGGDRPDVLQWVKFSGITWHPDGSGFWYNRYDAPKDGEQLTGVNKFQKVCFHKLGTPQQDDVVVHQEPSQPEWGFGADLSDDGRFWVLAISHGADKKNAVLVRELVAGRLSEPVWLASGFGANFTFAGSSDQTLYFRTDWGAPRGRLLAVDLRRATLRPPTKLTPSPLVGLSAPTISSEKSEALPAQWREVVAQADATLLDAALVGQGVILSWLDKAASRLSFVDLAGKPLKAPDFPTLGSISGLSGEAGQAHLYFSSVDFLAPPKVWDVDLSAATQSVWFQAKAGLAASDYEVAQVLARSKDGTQVPVFVVAKKGLPHDGSAPAYLYGYGGFAVSITPFYQPFLQAWLEAGGVLAVAVLRGGNEFGEAWHQAGQLGNKQNVFDDFIAAAEMLVAQKWTRAGRLAIAGGSNGGLLVGACMTQRPELFGAALPAVGVMDMLRYHLFTIGWAWVPEYGSSADAKAFDWLVRYSPLHNLKAGTAYPATLVTTGDHDDRVVPGHSFKFAAALQAAQAGPAPTLIRIETRAGHGAGKPTSKQIDEATDRMAFLFKVFDLAVPEAWR